MKLKKFTPELASGIIDAGFDQDFKDIQRTCIPKIKSGADLIVVAPEGSGKSSALVMGVIQQLKTPFEEAPRAIVIVSSKEKAFELEEQFEMLGKRTKLRTFVAFDKGILQYQKDMIYEGLDILICTPRRLTELVNVNGVPMTKIKMLVIDDSEEFVLNSSHSIIYRIADGLKNPQIVLFANKWHQKFDDLSERIMKSPIIVEGE